MPRTPELDLASQTLRVRGSNVSTLFAVLGYHKTRRNHYVTQQKPKTLEGFPVRYGTAPIEVDLSQENYNAGKRLTPRCCPFAVTLVNDVKKCICADVRMSVTKILVNDVWLQYPTPKSVRSQLIAFDNGGKIELGIYIFRPYTAAAIAEFGKAHSPVEQKHGRPGFHRAPSHPVNGVRNYRFLKR